MNTGIFISSRSAFPVLLVICCLFAGACRKDSFIRTADARISTSVDSLRYDTVFTGTGSVTKSFRINNLNSQKLLLSKIKLVGGAASPFRINVNGIAAAEVNDYELAAGDSIYVFVTANINAAAGNLPFIVKDSIEILFNGNSRFVQLEAFGQNANFLRNRIIRGNITWSNNLPYVILGSLQVDAGSSLTIAPGCRIYAHADAPLIVDGTLVVAGTQQEPVVFTGDRLDDDYKDLPASWPGIYFRGSSHHNSLTHTVIKNAYQALVAEQLASGAAPKLLLHQCVIDNAFDAGILCVNSSVVADNSLISNCGKNISILYGGQYDFTNCTAASYSSFLPHKNPVLEVSNFAVQDGTTLTSALTARFRNCIFWGEDGLVDDEVLVSKQGSNPFDVQLTNCLYRAKNEPANSTLNTPLKNQDPLFDSVSVSKRYFDFHTTSPSAPGLNAGVPVGFLKDLDDKNRSIGAPDLGCYEKQ